MSRYVVADVSNDPDAASRVPVSDELRRSVLDLGCEPAGYLGSWSGHFGFVAEVFAHATEPVVVATYNFSSWGEGVAFWTMLDDGTIVTTERSGEDLRLWSLSTRFLPLHGPRARFFTHAGKGTPKTLLEKHLKRVREVARAGSKPVRAPALALYVAMRLRNGDLQEPQLRAFSQLTKTLVKGFMLALTVPFVAWALATHGPRAALKVALPTLVIAFIVAIVVAPRLADLLTRGRGDSAPVPPEILLERASKIRRCNFDAIARR